MPHKDVIAKMMATGQYLYNHCDHQDRPNGRAPAAQLKSTENRFSKEFGFHLGFIQVSDDVGNYYG